MAYRNLWFSFLTWTPYNKVCVLFFFSDRKMKSIPAAVEICPYCKKPFKRLKSHLPHCKMAGDALFTSNSTEISSPLPDTGNSATPKCLNMKKKEQIKNTEKASKKEDKKSKPKLIGNEGKVKSNSVQPVDVAPVSNLVVARPDEQQEIKHSTKKSQQRENGMSRAPREDLGHIQAAEKELSKTNLLKKSPRVQKSRSKITFDKEKITSGIIQEPLIQVHQATSRSPDQLVKITSARQTKEGFAKLNVCSLEDFSMDSLQSIPQGVDNKVEQVIENHHVRVLRKRHDSSVHNIPLNEAAIGNQKIGHQPVESLSASADTSLAIEKQIITGTQNRVVELELEGNAWTVPNVPDQMAAGVKNMMDKNQLSVVSHEESMVYHNPKSNPYSTFTEKIQRDNDEKYNCNPTCLEKDTALDSGIIVISKGSSSGISLKSSSVHMLEITATQRLSSPKTDVQPGSLGLEWFPELYPNYQNLLTGKQKQWDTRIPKTPFIVPHEDWQGKKDRGGGGG